MSSSDLVQAIILLGLLVSLKLHVNADTVDSKRQGRVRGGQDIEAHQYPFLVNVMSGFRHLCGGVILDHASVLTSKTCYNSANGR